LCASCLIMPDVTTTTTTADAIFVLVFVSNWPTLQELGHIKLPTGHLCISGALFFTTLMHFLCPVNSVTSHCVIRHR